MTWLYSSATSDAVQRIKQAISGCPACEGVLTAIESVAWF